MGKDVKRNRKGMEGRREEGLKKERRTEKKEGIKKKSLLLALNRSGQFCWSSCL